MRPRLSLAMGSAIVLLLIIIPPPAVAAAERYKVKACGRGRDRVPRGRLSRAGGQRKITGGEIEPTITSNPGEPAEHHRDVAAGFQLWGTD
jgi:hypothetical protein